MLNLRPGAADKLVEGLVGALSKCIQSAEAEGQIDDASRRVELLKQITVVQKKAFGLQQHLGLKVLPELLGVVEKLPSPAGPLHRQSKAGNLLRAADAMLGDDLGNPGATAEAVIQAAAGCEGVEFNKFELDTLQSALELFLKTAAKHFGNDSYKEGPPQDVQGCSGYCDSHRGRLPRLQKEVGMHRGHC